MVRTDRLWSHMTASNPSIVIKRYANRKLYDTRASRYITLSQISQLLEAGEVVQILDRESGEDITEITLAQVFVDHRRKRPGSPPIDGLKDAFQSASEQVRRQIADPVSNIRQSFEQSMTRLLKSGEDRANETREHFQTWVSEQTQLFEETQRRLEDRLRAVSSRMEDFRGLREQLEALQSQVDQLTQRLKSLESTQKDETCD